MGKYVVTGGASGIGRAVVAQLKAADHDVLVVDLKAADVTADLSSVEGVDAAVQAVRAACESGIDGLVPCAGVSGIHSTELVARINYFAVVRCVQGLREQLAQRRGAVVLISSITSAMPSDDDAVNALLDDDDETALRLLGQGTGDQAYAASKRGISCWMRRECAGFLQDNIRINAVAPGYVDTPLNDEIREKSDVAPILDEFVASIPMGRPGQPEDVANLVCFLLSDKAAFMAGANVFVDGGHDAMMRQDRF